MKSYTVLGCVPPDSGSTFCTECCPDPAKCEEEHGAIFADSEWDYTPTCDGCGGAIEGVTVLQHNPPAPVYGPGDAGCYVDSARGVYMVDRIVEIAEGHGMPTPEGCDDKDCERCAGGDKTAGDGSHSEWAFCQYSHDVAEEATDFMNAFHPVAGHYWGYAEHSGDWGLWPEEDEEEEDEEDGAVKCPHCAGDCYPLGTLGNMAWYRCRACGTDVNR